MMTQEEQKTMWAVRGEMWKPSGSKAGSNKKLWPDDLRRRKKKILEKNVFDRRLKTDLEH